MATVTQSIEVEVPVRAAYDQWTQFEEFPEFMEGVEEVRQLDDTHIEWKAEIAGRTKEWEAEITEQHPDERVAWKSESGAPNSGVVTFHRLADGRCGVTVQMEAEPDGPLEAAGDLMGFLERRVKGDLERFKEFIENRESPTGAWRGNVERSADTAASGTALDEDDIESGAFDDPENDDVERDDLYLERDDEVRGDDIYGEPRDPDLRRDEDTY